MRVLAKYRNLLFQPADARVYSLFRIAFSVVVFINFLDLAQYRLSLFSGHGMIDVEFVKRLCAGTPYWSLFHYFQTEEAVNVIFLAAGAAIVCMGIGFLTRLSILIVYLWQLSYMHLVFPVLSGWDSVLTLYSFLLLISPVGGAWSVDGWLGKTLFNRAVSPVAPAYGLYMMRYQLCLIYISTVALKFYNYWWLNGEFYAYFMFSEYSLFQDVFFAKHVWISKILTYSTMAIEIAVPVLLLFRRTRLTGFVLGFSLHLGIMLTSKLFIFSLAMLTLYIPWLNSLSKSKPGCGGKINSSPLGLKMPIF